MKNKNYITNRENFYKEFIDVTKKLSETSSDITRKELEDKFKVLVELKKLQKY